MVKIDRSTLAHMGTVCPAQWDAVTEEYRENVYIRYRWGVLTIHISGKEHRRKDVGDHFDGDMTTGELLRHLDDLGL
jgi:hypothetical protein